jgi:hypothetical protein
MAICPIKILKDEQGKDFVPLTHMRAISGGEYVTSTFTATQDSAGNFTIAHDDIEENDLKDRIVGVTFPATVSTSTSGYKLRFKNSTTEYLYYTITIEDGSTALDVTKYKNTTCLLKRNESNWQLIKTGVVDMTHPGHTILNSSGTGMTYRTNLRFNGMTVTDSSTATLVAPLVVNNLTTASAGNGALDAYQGKLLNDKFSSYLPKSGGTLTGDLTGKTINATTFVGALNGKATSAGSADSAGYVANKLTLQKNKVNTEYNGSSAQTIKIPTVHSGKDTPSNGTGQDGDIYILLG